MTGRPCRRQLSRIEQTRSIQRLPCSDCVPSWILRRITAWRRARSAALFVLCRYRDNPNYAELRIMPTWSLADCDCPAQTLIGLRPGRHNPVRSRGEAPTHPARQQTAGDTEHGHGNRGYAAVSRAGAAFRGKAAFEPHRSRRARRPVKDAGIMPISTPRSPGATRTFAAMSA